MYTIKKNPSINYQQPKKTVCFSFFAFGLPFNEFTYETNKIKKILFPIFRKGLLEGNKFMFFTGGNLVVNYSRHCSTDNKNCE